MSNSWPIPCHYEGLRDLESSRAVAELPLCSRIFKHVLQCVNNNNFFILFFQFSIAGG